MSADTKETAPARYFEVDVAKTLAIVFMVCVHVYEGMTDNSWLGNPPTDFLHNLIEFMGGPMAAPVFMFAMGIGMVCTRHDTPGEFIHRGIRLLIGGIVLNFFKLTLLLLIARVLDVEYDSIFTVLESLLVCDILHFAGLAFILTGLLKKLHVHPFMILVLSLLMQMGASWATVFVEPSNIFSMLFGFFVFTGKTSGFPLLLWYVYPAAGMAFAALLKKADDRAALYRNTLAISVAVLSSLICCLIQNGYDLKELYMLAHESYYMQDLFHSLFSLSLVLIFLSLAYFAFCGVSAQARPMRFFHWCSINLNKIYVIQWMVICYTVAALVLLEMDMVSLPMVIPVGIFISLVSMGLCAVLNSLRRRIQKK